MVGPDSPANHTEDENNRDPQVDVPPPRIPKLDQAARSIFACHFDQGIFGTDAAELQSAGGDGAGALILDEVSASEDDVVVACLDGQFDFVFCIGCGCDGYRCRWCRQVAGFEGRHFCLSEQIGDGFLRGTDQRFSE